MSNRRARNAKKLARRRSKFLALNPDFTERDYGRMLLYSFQRDDGRRAAVTIPSHRYLTKPLSHAVAHAKTMAEYWSCR